MKIHVVAFATAGDLLGHEGLELELPPAARLSDLANELRARYAELEALWPRLAIAIDGQLVQGDPELAPGCEVALLPPVSGGSGEPAAAPTGVLTDGPIDSTAIEAAISSPRRGALLSFRGIVRDSHDGRQVSHLTYSAYPLMARRTIERIVQELENGDPDLRLAIVHRLGEVAAGEASVVIAAAAPHREAAYAANRQALERLKREVPIWKKEHFIDGSAEWREVEPLATRPKITTAG